MDYIDHIEKPHLISLASHLFEQNEANVVYMAKEDTYEKWELAKLFIYALKFKHKVIKLST